MSDSNEKKKEKETDDESVFQHYAPMHGVSDSGLETDATFRPISPAGLLSNLLLVSFEIAAKSSGIEFAQVCQWEISYCLLGLAGRPFHHNCLFRLN